ncbi:lysine-specific demethylase 2A [Ananas comosus]|uniref:Lysine-specific demethylase 2A n=2 Tax=Ananas comosus TaxID=4615 RepID=A0A6P5GSV5_ANACO|nr:lysine-specific demethylase 2A [Ananas comosus]CAD1824939.1 unnamed protein product [Ananas comosus var. bracteatus]
MAYSWCLSAPSLAGPSPAAVAAVTTVGGGRRDARGRGFSAVRVLAPLQRGRNGRSLVVCMAPEEEKMTRRSPLDFPIEWERPKPGRRPDIFPKFSPMKTPLPTPLPADPPEEDEEEEEEKKEEEEEEDPDKEDPDKPEKQSWMF